MFSGEFSGSVIRLQVVPAVVSLSGCFCLCVVVSLVEVTSVCSAIVMIFPSFPLRFFDGGGAFSFPLSLLGRFDFPFAVVRIKTKVSVAQYNYIMDLFVLHTLSNT